MLLLESLRPLAEKLAREGVQTDALYEAERNDLQCFYKLWQAGWVDRREVVRQAKLSYYAITLLGLDANGVQLRRLHAMYSQGDG